jgi:hypothetical protein
MVREHFVGGPWRFILNKGCFPTGISFILFSYFHSTLFLSRLPPPVHAGSSLADFSTLKIEAIRSSETSVHTRSTRRHIPENGILQYEVLFATSSIAFVCNLVSICQLAQSMIREDTGTDNTVTSHACHFSSGRRLV